MEPSDGKSEPMSPRPGRAEHRVDERMGDDVAVAVTGEAAWRVEAHAAEHERHPLCERVRVDAQADTEAHPSGSCRACLRSNTVTVS